MADISVKAQKQIDACKNNKSTTLNLSNCNLIEIPEEIEEFTWLTNINFSQNNLTKIQHLTKLINLTRLNLSYNKILQIEGLENLVNVSTLDISVNSLKKRL